MPVIELCEIVQLLQEQSGKIINPNQDCLNSPSFDQQLQLIVKQKHLGLPVEPILKQHPLIGNWVNELEELIPGLFKPNKKLYLDYPLTAQLQVDKNNCIWLQIPVNFGISKGSVRLFEWGMRKSIINFQDYIKLWAACEVLKLNPNQIAIEIFAFQPNRETNKTLYCWDRKKHKKIFNFLSRLLNEDAKIKKSKENQVNNLNVGTIEEL